MMVVGETHQPVYGSVGLCVNVAAFVFAVLNGGIDELGVCRLVDGSQDQGWVRGGVLFDDHSQ